MRIKKLKLVGFKSFVEPAELSIEAGLTGIVGPNGCGKSNLLEAIRWAMGEGSPKSLRGGGMEDVIFAGTTSRPARSFAEVSIHAECDPHENLPNFVDQDGGELEISRRIERGAGSAYRANGRDVRAKDIALIFADAATGAHSPALVSQGRIGAIISAKPQERRQMLEEAAGISGLHVRRKDAEQKLRATETNLDRLSTIFSDMDTRATQLRKQARQAEKYRKLAREIAQAEARLIFVRWRTAKMAADAARAEAEAAEAEVAKASECQAGLQEQQREAANRLASDRAIFMATSDAANDLSGRIIRMQGELERIIGRRSDLLRQQERMAEDGARENRLTHDAAAALDKLKTDAASLADEVKLAEGERPALSRRVDSAEHLSRENELALARAMAEQARTDAEARVAAAALQAAQKRLQRAEEDMENIRHELSGLGKIEDGQAAKAEAEMLVARLEREVAEYEGLLASCEEKRAGLTLRREEMQSEIAAIRAELSALQSEKSALERSLSRQEGKSALDNIKVSPGYEHALAAALGEDAHAAIGGESGRRWAGARIDSTPAVENSLSAHVTAPAELTARLSMVKIVDEDDGHQLNPGERLVTRAGHMRRWDGFIAEDDGAAMAEQLIRANRLEELEATIPQVQDRLDDVDRQAGKLDEEIAQAKADIARHQGARQQAEQQLRTALRDVDRAEDALNRLQAAQTLLNGQLAQAQEDVATARMEQEQAVSAQAGLPDGDIHRKRVAQLTEEGELARTGLIRAQADLSALDQRIAQSRERRAVTMADMRNWQERAGEAEQRIAEMNRRAAEIAAELAAMDGQPERIGAETEKLTTERAQIGDKLDQLQKAEQASEAALRILEGQLSESAETLSEARERRAGAQARAEAQEARRTEMGQLSGERFECPPPVLPEKLDFEESSLGHEEEERIRHERLQSERERIGPVNLIAAEELAELEGEQERNRKEIEELTQAVHRLRGSIGNLNREGRQRLLAAFEEVDRHFRRLFTTLFSGGQAHLQLVDSDDPLAAGLEIMAQPPGKKLASLTLLSGGEQALTAIALIFGLFLTNPAPICVLDEVDAPLDDANIERFCDLLDRMNEETETRYLIVTHNAVTMSRMHRLFGVTMVEQGVSRLVSVDLGGAEELLAAE